MEDKMIKDYSYFDIHQRIAYLLGVSDAKFEVYQIVENLLYRLHHFFDNDNEFSYEDKKSIYKYLSKATDETSVYYYNPMFKLRCEAEMGKFHEEMTKKYWDEFSKKTDELINELNEIISEVNENNNDVVNS
jgi:hypothetical protein